MQTVTYNVALPKIGQLLTVSDSDDKFKIKSIQQSHPAKFTRKNFSIKEKTAANLSAK